MISLLNDNKFEFRVPGKSKGALVLQKTQLFQRAVFFALLNPQPDGACFAGMLTNVTHLDLSEMAGQDCQGLVLQVRAQASHNAIKLCFMLYFWGVSE